MVSDHNVCVPGERGELRPRFGTHTFGRSSRIYGGYVEETVGVFIPVSGRERFGIQRAISEQRRLEGTFRSVASGWCRILPDME